MMSTGEPPGIKLNNKSYDTAFLHTKCGKLTIHVAQIILFGAVVALVGNHFASHWETIRHASPPSFQWILLGSVLGLIGLGVQSYSCWLFLSAQGLSISLRQAVGLLHVPILAKYIPGRIWAILGSLWIYDRAGIPRKLAALSIGVNMIVGLSSMCFLAFTLGAGVFPALVSPWLSGVPLLGLLIFMDRNVFRFISKIVLRMLKCEIHILSLSRLVFLQMLFLNCLAWMIYGAGFYCIVRSIKPTPLDLIPQFVALFSLAQVAGFVAFFAPSGIGVREGVFLLALNPIIGAPSAIIVTASCRVWQTSLELIIAAIGWQFLKSHNKQQQSTENNICS